MRLFIAINLPAETRCAIAEATAPLREAAPGAAWVAPESLHLTVKFLGERPAEWMAELAGRLGELAQRHRPVDLVFGGVGAFPNLRAPRIVWMGVAHEPKLELLQHDVERACEALGIPLEGRPFRPHLTLGRVRRELGRDAIRALGLAARGVRYSGAADVRTLDLMSSNLSPAGSRYTVECALPLGGA